MRITLLVMLFFALMCVSQASAMVGNVTLNSPVNAYNTSDTTPEFNFTVQGNSTTYNCTLLVDAVEKGNNGSVSNSTATIITSSTLAEGLHNWSINCSDNYGYNISGNRSISIDVTFPTLSILRPQNNSVQANRTFAINFTATDTNLVRTDIYIINGLGVVVNSTNSTVSGNQVVGLNANADGVYNITLITYDSAGNNDGESLINITVDTAAPTASFTSPASWSNSTAFLVNATLNGTGTAISAAYFYANNGSTTVAIANYTDASNNTAGCTQRAGSYVYDCLFNATVAAQGQYNISALAYDSALITTGNNGTAVRTFTVDTTAPDTTYVFVNTSNTNNSLALVGNTIRILFNSTENMTSATVTIAGNSATVTNNSVLTSKNASYVMNASDADGLINYTITMTDAAGNSYAVSNTTNITFDANPTGSVSDPADATTYVIPSTTSYLMNGTANDTTSGVANVSVYVNGAFNGTAGHNSTTTLWNYNLTALSVGTYNLSTRIYDNSGNVIYVNRTLVVYNSSPTVNITYPLATTYSGNAGAVMAMSFNASHPIGINTCWYAYNGTTTANATISLSNTSVTCTNNANNAFTLYLASGSYMLFLYANDSAGNMRAYNVSFNVSDTTGPTISNPSPSTTQTTTPVSLSVTTDENATCNYNDVDNTSWDTGNMHSFTSNILSHTKSYSDVISDNNIYVRCTDMSGNKAYSLIHFKYNSGSSSPSGGGGGGGGGGGSTNDGTLRDSASLIYTELPRGTKTIDVSSMLITALVLTTSSDATNVHFVITRKSTSALIYNTSRVYHYFDIEHENLGNEQISSVKIRFRVEKSWLTLYGIKKEDVVMARQANGWTDLTTTLLSDDSTYAYYQATSPGLSTFVVAGFKRETANITNQTSANATLNTTANTTAIAHNLTFNESHGTGDDEAQRPPASKPWAAILGVLIVIVVIVLAAYFFKRRGAQPTGQQPADYSYHSQPGSVQPPAGQNKR